MSALVAVAFLCGMIALLTGAARAVNALRAAVAAGFASDQAAGLRALLPSLGWGAVALYGLVLAGAGMLLTA